MSITIGLLIPRSDIFPTFPQHIVKGLKLAFENSGIDAQFIVSDIGKGVMQDLVMAKANELIMQEVDITVAYAGKKVLDGLKTLFKSSKKPLMIMGMGPNIIRDEEYGETPYIAGNSFDVWHTNYLLGEYAANKVGKQGIASIGLFEGGYQFLPAFNEGVTNNGGSIAATHITKKLDEVDFSGDLNNIIQSTSADYVVEFFSGIDAHRFYDLCIKSGLSKGLPIVTTSLGAEPFVAYNKRAVHGLSWQPFIDNAVNKQMITLFKEKYSEEPSAYLALAYETALWMIEGIKACSSKFDTNTYCNAITAANFLGPRGDFSVNQKLNCNATFPTIIVDGNTVTDSSLPPELETKLIELFSSRVQAGWFNPYPCA
ncbi:MAG: ABC transporter substrate-binding protein [Bacteroidota bacterium]